MSSSSRRQRGREESHNNGPPKHHAANSAEGSQEYGRLSSGGIAGAVIGGVFAIALAVLALLRTGEFKNRVDIQLPTRLFRFTLMSNKKMGQSMRELDHKNAIVSELNQNASRLELHGNGDTLELADPASPAVVAELEAGEQ